MTVSHVNPKKKRKESSTSPSELYENHWHGNNYIRKVAKEK